MKGYAMSELDAFLMNCEHFDNSQREAIVNFTSKLNVQDED